MMRREGVAEHGHLQINENVLASVVELHKALLADPRFADYTAEFYRTLPYVVELRAKAGDKAQEEVATCLTALYGMLLLRLQGKELTADTITAMKQISHFIATLAAYFRKNEQEPLFGRDEQG